MQTDRCRAKIDAAAIAFSKVPQDIIAEKIAFHTDVVSFLWKAQPYQDWVAGSAHPSITFIANYVNTMFEETSSGSIVGINEIEPLHTQHQALFGKDIRKTFGFTALSTLCYATAVVRGNRAVTAEQFVCQLAESEQRGHEAYRQIGIKPSAQTIAA